MNGYTVGLNVNLLLRKIPLIDLHHLDGGNEGEKMKIEKRNKLMLKIFNEALQLSDAKGKDYSGDEDSLANLRVFGFKGIIIRLFDKLYRLKNIEEAGKIEVKDESVKDTLMDTIIYSALALILLMEDKEMLKRCKDKIITCDYPPKDDLPDNYVSGTNYEGRVIVTGEEDEKEADCK